ncbi:MAG: glycosyltransferase [Candidatus Magasanikbacteria bacterium]|nr:glycosyltransferase [Candidatus Magasanikbacteria bacterium]
MANPKILILHDYFLYKGGGERLVISLAKNLHADIATAFIGKDAFDPRAEGIHTIELYKEKAWSNLPGFRYLQVQFSFLFKTGFAKKYDIIIYSGDCLIALTRLRSKRNIAYMHTPPRHLYDTYQNRLTQYPLWKKIIFIPFVRLNRWRFETLSRRLDLIITNSKNTQERIKKYLGLESVVVYPPCDTLPFKNLGYGEYFFSWARLYDVKRVDKIVEAFVGMPDKKLVVASGGPELEKIKNLAKGHNNITILGWVSDEQLLEYLGKCLATIYIPIREDFGMSAVESMQAGKPVIGVAEGGLLEIIEDGKNGILLPPNFNTNNLREAVKNMTLEKAVQMEEFCQKTAQKFTEKTFIAEMKKAANLP